MKKRILFTGGGTLGPVIPLIPVLDLLKSKGCDVYWIGVNGVEKDFIRKKQVKYGNIVEVKLRRYFDWRNFLIPFYLILALFKTVYYILKWNIDVIVSAGGYTAVPVSLAGFLFGKKIVIHQQDVEISLSNKIISYIADIATVSLPEQEKFFKDKSKKVIYTGNPARKEVVDIRGKDKKEIIKDIENITLKKSVETTKRPLLLIFGGGTGSQQINELVAKGLNKIKDNFFIVHITGKGKSQIIKSDNYLSFETLFDDFIRIMKLSDIVVCRSGFSTITELACLAKPSILIPMPGTHQEKNAKYFSDKNSALCLNLKGSESDDVDVFIETVLDLCFDENKKQTISSNISTLYNEKACENIVKNIL